jgi:hypothetical protein
MYDGSPKTVQVATTPADLPVTLTYNNSTALPLNAGVYEVSATVNSAGYVGSTSGTLTITPAEAAIRFDKLTQTYTGTSIAPQVSTIPAGLPVKLTFNESALVP